jgi:hypothetical protein
MTNLTWRISTFSGGGSSCVEVAAEADAVHVRNSNARDAGTLTVDRSAMAALVTAVAAGGLDDLT